MLTCKPLAVQPCIQYDPENPAALVEFILLNQGTMPRFQASGTAELFSLKNGEPRGIYLKPGSWLRCLAPGSFYADSDEVFRATYQLRDAEIDGLVHLLQEDRLAALITHQKPSPEQIANYLEMLVRIINRNQTAQKLDLRY